jgi:hypothetical protein
MKKHQALQAEIAGHEPRIQNVCVSGNNMMKEGHFAKDTISGKIHDLQDRWQQLKVGSWIWHCLDYFIFVVAQVRESLKNSV